MRLCRHWSAPGLALVALVFVATIAACASRELPSSLPRTSAASTEAKEGRAHVVTQSLSEDPPLPGEASEGWHGLRSPGKPAGGGHEHHHDAPAGARYACPMHPDVVSAEAGRCPRCGMQLVRKP